MIPLQTSRDCKKKTDYVLSHQEEEIKDLDSNQKN